MALFEAEEAKRSKVLNLRSDSPNIYFKNMAAFTRCDARLTLVFYLTDRTGNDATFCMKWRFSSSLTRQEKKVENPQTAFSMLFTYSLSLLFTTAT